MFKDKPWKEWKTRKITLIGAIISIMIYTSIGLIMGWFGHELDSTLTEQFFSFAKWLVGTGCIITISKVAKGKTNSDNDEVE